MPQYHQPQKAKAAKLNAQATVDYAAGEKAGSNSDDYVRTTVYLAIVLFLAGIGSHFDYRSIRYGLAGFGGALASGGHRAPGYRPEAHLSCAAMTPPEDVGTATAMFVDRGGRRCPPRDGDLTGHLATGGRGDPCPTSTKEGGRRGVHAGQASLAWWWPYVLLSSVPHK